jgi:hypothetical protein
MLTMSNNHEGLWDNCSIEKLDRYENLYYTNQMHTPDELKQVEAIQAPPKVRANCRVIGYIELMELTLQGRFMA